MTRAPSDPPRHNHRAMRELLPWLANGTLHGRELARLRTHLEVCDACRREAGFDRQLTEALGRRPAPDVAAHPARVAALLRRIEANESAGRRQPPRRLRLPRTLWLLVAGQAAAVVALVIALLVGGGGRAHEEAVPEFRTLSQPEVVAPADSGARIRVVFVPEIAEQEIRELLVSIGGRIVDGPSGLGVYTIELTGGDPRPTVDRLRDHPAIRFVEAAARP